jgi:hypothetical protein
MGNLASAVDELLALDADALSGPGLAETIIELRRQINRAEAAYLHLLERLDRTGAATADHGSTAAWVRAELHRSPAPASADVHLARDLADAFPATRAALADGSLSPAHARLICSLRKSINAEAIRSAEPHLVEWAAKSTPKELRGVIAHVKHSYGPDKAKADERDDYQARSLHASTTIGGIGVGNWTLHPLGQETVMAALHAASRPVAGDNRSPAQRRADALVTIAELALRSGQLPITGGVKPHLSVIVDLATLTGADGAPGADYGFGATSSTIWAQRMSCDAQIARIVFGPRGDILDSGRATRSFTAAQLRAITARDRHCIWPGCDAPPGWCHAHHRTHWGHGGPSSVTNGALLCGRHHDRVHVNGHQIIRTTSGPYQVNLTPGSDPQVRAKPKRAHPNRN